MTNKTYNLIRSLMYALLQSSPSETMNRLCRSRDWMDCGWKQQDQKLTEDCESENHVLHDFITQTATCTLRSVHSGLQVALVHPDFHLFLHFVGTERSKEGRRAGINYRVLSCTMRNFYTTYFFHVFQICLVVKMMLMMISSIAGD